MSTDTFDIELATALRGYVSDAPTDVDALELSRRVAAAHPRRLNLVSQVFARNRYAWVIVAVLVALALLASFLVAQRLLERRPSLFAFQQGGNIYMAESEASVRLIAASDADHDFRLSQWSPDGQLLAIADTHTVSVFELATDELREIPLPDARTFSTGRWFVEWSPDSRFVLIVQYSPEGVSRLIQIELASEVATRLADYNVCFPVMSPDGRWIVWYNGHEVFVFERSTGEAIRVGSVGWFYCGFDGGSKWDWPSWSADSERIVFVADDGSIKASSPDGTALDTIIPADARGAIYAAGEGLERPIWSPDGKLISYLDDGDLMVVRPDGSEARLLVAGPIDARRLSWTSDSTHIDFGRTVEPNDERMVMWNVDVATGGFSLVEIAAPSVEGFARQP